MLPKTTDSKGRVTLGPKFANRAVLIEAVDDTEVRVIAARIIPERELWLHQNEASDKYRLLLEGAAFGDAHGFEAVWTPEARRQYDTLEKQGKGGRARGLFKQVRKAIRLLLNDPRHPGLQTHPFRSLENPYRKDDKVFEAYAQNKTPAAYRIFWCYGPGQQQITIIAITAHP